MKILLPEINLYFDGSCERNPGGLTTYGWVVTDADKGVLLKGGGIAAERDSPLATNNYGEWCGLYWGLRALIKINWRGQDLRIFGDSQLVIKQLKFHWASRKQYLRQKRDECRSLLKELGCHWKANWIPREQNTICHKVGYFARYKGKVQKSAGKSKCRQLEEENPLQDFPSR